MKEYKDINGPTEIEQMFNGFHKEHTKIKPETSA